MPILLKKIKEEYSRTLVKSKGNKSDKLYIHLYKLLSKMLIKTEIPENSVLPPTRVLSIELGLSRSTVLRAYDMLVLDGLLITKRSSGYQVKPKEVLVDKPEMTNETTEFQLSEIGKSFLKLSNFSISNSQENLAFSPGLPPLDIFPVSQWKNLTNMYWKEIKFSNLTYSPSSGIDKLKYNIATYLSLTRNIKCEPSQVFIMSGSLQSLYLLGTMLVNPGEHVFLEDPTFPNVHAIFKGLMANVHGIPLDINGMSIELMEAQKSKPKLIHVTPSCHYPSGLKMPLERRLELIEYANNNKALIIENDYEHELNNWENPVPSIFSLDQNQNSIYLGTFNRVLHPSLRIGYMIVPHRLKHPLEVMMKHSHRFVAPSIQFVLNQFIEKKVLHSHLNKMISITKERKLFFIQTFDEIFKAAGFTIVPNDVLSLQTLIKLDSTYIDKDLVAVLNQHNLSAHSYNKCFISDSKEQGLIMGHCSIQKHIIKNKLIRMHNTIFEM